MGTQRSTRHHLVPQWYLRAWADDNDRVTAVDRDRPDHTFPAHVRKVTVNGNFFTVETPEGPSDVVEVEYLSRLDGVAKAAVDAILAGTWPLMGDHRRAIAQFLAVQQFRSQRARDKRNDTLTNVMQKAYKMRISQPGGLERVAREANGGREPTPEELKAAGLFANQFRVAESPNHIIKLFGIAEEMTPVLFFMDWTLVETDGTFLTGDHPVVLVPPAWHRPPFGVGLLSCDHVALPLTPQHLLQLRLPADPNDITEDHRRDRTARIGEKGTLAYNHLVLRQVERTVVMQRGSRWPLPPLEA